MSRALLANSMFNISPSLHYRICSLHLAVEFPLPLFDNLQQNPAPSFFDITTFQLCATFFPRISNRAFAQSSASPHVTISTKNLHAITSTKLPSASPDFMPSPSLAAKRRSARNAPSFQIALITLFIIFAALTWRLYTTPYHPFTMTSSSSHTSKPSAAQHDLPPSAALHVAINRTTHLPLRLISYNIRYANSRPVRGERPWPIRAPKLATQLRFITEAHPSAFICLQECLHVQVLDLAARLGPRWAYIGRGRDASPTAGEFSPIFYQKDAWTCTRNETRWLSPTPAVPSRGWDAALNRIVTIGEFAHRGNGTKVVVMSTHFDHIGVVAREESARLLLAIAREWRDGGGGSGGKKPAAVLLGGDFNSEPDDRAYRVMVGEGSGMSDIADLVAPEDRYGNEMTYTSFGEVGRGEAPQRIDFLFVQEPRGAIVKSFGVLANMFDDGVRISDHRPVVADMEIPL